MTSALSPSARRLVRAGVTLLLVAVVALRALTGCSRDEPEQAVTPSIEPIEGMKYYVGGPVMKADAYGRFRIAGFNGEISAPTTRGLLVGEKMEGKKFEFRTWINGKLVSRSTGFLDDDGLYWYEERFTYHFNGKSIARQELHYDDQRKIMASKLEQLDPETGEIVRTHEQEIPYTPVDAEDDDWDEGEPDDQKQAEPPSDGEGSIGLPYGSVV